jgi:hypothetical protein
VKATLIGGPYADRVMEIHDSIGVFINIPEPASLRVFLRPEVDHEFPTRIHLTVYRLVTGHKDHCFYEFEGVR